MVYNIAKFKNAVAYQDPGKKSIEQLENQAKVKLAHLLKALRLDLGRNKGQEDPISMRELARMLKVSNATIMRWESEVALPDGENLAKIAKLKNWDVEALMKSIGLGIHSPPSSEELDEYSTYINLLGQVNILSQEQKISLIKFLLDSLVLDNNNPVPNSRRSTMTIINFSLLEREKLGSLLQQSLQHQGKNQRQFAKEIGSAVSVIADICNADESLQISNELLDIVAPHCFKILSFSHSSKTVKLDLTQSYANASDLLVDLKRTCSCSK